MMELASAGTLDERAWPEAAGIILEILGAAAHMHTRHVVHRDIKPSNVLFMEGREPRLRIADFGIAHATDRVSRTGLEKRTVGTTERPLGTPRYAALEQRLGKWREYGPWTDVYSIGILAADLIGRPCAEEDPKQLPLPRTSDPLRPRISVPKEFPEWIRSATATRPADRFQSAAEARTALIEMGAAPAERPTIPGYARGPAGNAASEVELMDLGSSSNAGRHLPPLPESGRAFSAYVDPESTLQSLLARVENPGVSSIVGPPGIGRRRLALEMGFRLREFDPRATLDLHCRRNRCLDACADSLHLRFRTQGLDEKRTLRRMSQSMKDADAQGELLELLTGPGDSTPERASVSGELRATLNVSRAARSASAAVI